MSFEPPGATVMFEPPPLAIDVYSTRSEDQARLEALRLAAELEKHAGWTAVPDFPI